MVALWLYVPCIIYVFLAWLRTIDQYYEAKKKGDRVMMVWHVDGIRLGVWVFAWASFVIVAVAWTKYDELREHLQFLYWL